MKVASSGFHVFIEVYFRSITPIAREISMRVVSSLRRAFTLHYIIAAAVPIVLFGWFSLYYAEQYLLDDVFRTNTFLAREVRAQVEEFLNQRSQSLKHVANTIFNVRAVRPENIEHYLSEEIENIHDFESIHVLDRTGKVVYLGLGESQKRWRKDFHGVDLSGHELFQAFASGNDLSWSDTYTSLVTGEPAISLGVVAGDYLVVGNLSLRRLGEIVSRFSLYGRQISTDYVDPSMLFAIVDRKGVPLAHTDVQTVLRQQSMRYHPEIMQALSGKAQTGVYDHDNVRVVDTSLPVVETGWAVWISRNYDLVTEPLSTTRNVFFLILLSSILAAILSGLVTARNVMRPLGVLVEGVRALATGGGSIQPSRQSYLEIDELTRGFHRMSQSVLDRETSLRESETRFRSLVNSVEGIVFEARFPDLEFTFVSERSVQILGYAPEELTQSADFWQQWIHPEDRQWALNYIKSQAEKGRNHQFEYRMQHKEGHVIWIRQMVNVVKEGDSTIRLLGVMIDVTASKEAAISLLESEQRFRNLVEQAADAILIHDANGQMVDVNEQACRSLGYTRSELKQKKIPDIQILKTSLEFASLQSSVMYGGSLTYEAEYRRKNNTQFPAEIRLGSFQYQDKQLFLALVRDVTDRKKAVAALRESEERYRGVVSTMREGVVLTDHNGRIIAVNPAAEKILRASADEIIGMLIEDDRWPRRRTDGSLFEVDQLPAVLTRQTGQPVNGAMVGFPGEGGAIAWIEVNTQPVQLAATAQKCGVVITMNDVTEKRAAEQALRDSEERVRLLLDSTAEGIFGVDCDGACTFMNPAGLELLGYGTESDVLGRNTHELFHHSHPDGEYFAQEDCPICQVCHSGASFHSDTDSFWRADGKAFPVEYFAQPILKENSLVGVVIVFHDVTERKLMQQQSIRTAQLASLGELAAGVAHEINNPISGVINYAQILLNQNRKSGEDTDLVERIIKEGERVATIVKDLLFFSRESGPEMNLTNIGEALEDSLSLSAAQIRKEGILLSTQYPDDLPLISSRAQQIQQLFLNILSNARHALNQKYPEHDPDKKIEISIKPIEHDATPYLRIVCKDYGTGIPAQMLDRILLPFVTTKPTGVGTGLGLSICFEIVKNHGGKLWVESSEGESTEVFIELPVTRKD